MNAEPRGSHQAILLELALLMNERRSVQEVFAAFAERLLATAQFDFTAIVSVEPDPRFLRLLGHHPVWPDCLQIGDVVEVRDAPDEWLKAGLQGVEFTPTAEGAPLQARHFARGFRQGWVAALVAGETLGGYLIVSRVNARPLAQDQLDFLRAAARLLAGALRQDRLVEDAEREAAQGDLLNELAVLLHAGEPVEALFDRMLVLIEKAIQLDHISLAIKTQQGRYQLVGARPALGLPVGAEYPPEAAQDDAVFAAPENLLEYRSDRNEGFWPELYRAGGIVRIVSAGLTIDGERLGMVSIGRAANFAFSETDRRFISRLAVTLSQAEANIRRIRRIEASAAREQVLNELAVLLNAGEPVDALMDRLPVLLERALEFDYVGLVVPTDHPGMVRNVGSRPAIVWPAGTLLTLDEAAITPVLDEVGIIQFRTDHAPSSPPLARLQEAGIRRLAVAVLRDGDGAHGALVLGRERNRPYSAEDVEFLEVVSTLLGQAMANQLRVQRAEANAARGRALNELTVLLNAGEPVDTLFDRLLALLEQAIEFDYVGLLVASDEPGQLRMVGSRPELIRPVGSTIDFEASGLTAVSQSPGLTQFRADRVAIIAGDALREAGILRVAAVALRDGQEPIGLFSIARRRNLPYSPQDVEFIEVLVTILGQAVANQRRLQRAQAEVARSHLLNEVAVLVNAGQPPQTFFDRLTELLQEAIQFDNMAMLLPEGDGSLRVVGSLHSRVLKTGAVFPAERYFDGRPATDGRLVHQVSTSELASQTGREAAAAGMRWVTTAILREGDELLGVFTLSRDADTRFTRADMELLELLATLLGQALANDRRLRQSRAEAARSKLLSELAVMLNAGEPTDIVFSRVVALLKPIVEWDRTSMMLLDPERNMLRFVASLPGDVAMVGDELPVKDLPLSLAEMAALPSLRFRLADMPVEVANRIAAAGGTWALATALRQRGELLGLFSLARDSDLPFTDEETLLVELVSTLLAQSLAGEQRIRRTLSEAARSRLLNELSLLLNAGEPVEAMFDLLPPLLSSAVAFHYVGVAFEAGRQDWLRAVDWNSRAPGPATPTWIPRNSLGLDALQRSGRAIVQVSFGDNVAPGTLAEEFARSGLQRSVLAPLGSAERPLGVLHVGRAHDEPFTADDLAFLEVVATIFSQAITNQARVTAAAAEAEEQRIVAAVAAAVAAETDPGALVGAIVQPLRALIPRPFVAFGYIDGEELVYPAPNRTIRLPIEPYTRLAIDLGQIHSPELPDDLTRQSPLWEFGVKANATTLARSGGVPAGILVTGSREEGYTFGQRELRIFRLIAQIVGPAMENVRSAARARQEAEEQRILAEVAAIAAAEKDPYDILQGLVAPLAHLVDAPFAAYGWFDRDEIVYLAANGEERRQPVSPLQAQGRDEGQVVSHGEELGPNHVARQYGLHAISYTAIRSGGAVTGLLFVASREASYSFAERELRILGEVARIVGPAIEARLAERNVARQSALYSLILRSLREGVVLLDSEDRAVFENSTGRKVLAAIDPGRRSNSVAKLADLLAPIAREEFLESVRQGKPSQGRAPLTVEGEKRWLDYELVALDDPHFRLLFVTSDVTDAVHREAERAQLEQASRLAALGELIGGVAHELNNPLTAILGFAEIIGLSPAASALREEVSIIQKEAVRARNIVRDLLFIARPAPVEQREVAVDEIVAHIERLRKAAWSQSGIQVTLDVPPAGCLVWGNEHQLTQVLLNLITNAEHAVEGRLTRTIRVSASRTGDEVEIVVADSGAGMTAEVAERVFEPFFTTKQGSGTGLGLSLSYSIVQSHHGRIDVQSLPGSGTQFRVTLPALATTPAEPACESEPAPGRPARVLVVDDEPSLRKVCQRLVKSMGHECEVAESSASAREIATQQEFDLVLCDYRLASETAADVMEAFADVAPQLIERTVIATGATTDAGVVDVTAKYGLKLIGKPYGADELAAIIAEAQRRTSTTPA